MTNIIKNAKYNKDIETGKNISINCVFNGIYVSVPLSEQNADYQAILEWAKIDGNTIADAD